MKGYAGNNKVDITDFGMPIEDKNNLKVAGIVKEDIEKHQD